MNFGSKSFSSQNLHQISLRKDIENEFFVPENPNKMYSNKKTQPNCVAKIVLF